MKRLTQEGLTRGLDEQIEMEQFLQGITHNTEDPAPDGIGHFNPIKLYTSKELINYMGSQNKTMEIYWDDLKIWKDKRPD